MTGAEDRVRTDVLDTTDRIASPPETGRTPTRSRVAKALPVVVGGLVLVTSAAVAAVSWWLVPPYLALMAFLLLEPAGRRVSATNPAGPGSAPSEAPASAESPDPAESAGSNEPPAPPEPVAAPTRARRTGKGRGPRKAKSTVELAPATWVQVAPGKFVRVEPGNPPAESGPHHEPPSGAPKPSRAEAAPRLDETDRPSADPGSHDAPTEAALEHPHRETTPAEGPAPEGPRDPHAVVTGRFPDDGAPADPAEADDVPGRIAGGLGVPGWPAIDPAPELEGDGHGRSPEGSASPDPDRPGPGPSTDPVAPGPGLVPDLAAHGVEAAEPDPTAPPEPRTIDDPDHAAGTQPEAAAGTLVDGRPEGAPVAVEATARAEAPAPCDAPDPGPEAEDDARAEGLAPEVAADALADRADDPGEADVEAGPADRADGPSPGDVPDAAGASDPARALAAWFGRMAPPPRRAVRTAHPRAPRRPHGLRLRSKRGDGRPHHFARTFPPRSPPRRGLACA